jgi:peptide deformylase
MTIKPICIIPHDVLRQMASPLENGADEMAQKLAEDMFDTMYAAGGIGLAAPQIGLSKRLLVLDVAQDERGQKGEPLAFINPEIIWFSDEKSLYNEGCLSIPDQYAEVERPAKIRIRYLGLDNKEAEMEADDLLATCLQHEIDHLNGVLFIDHISKLKRDMIERKVKKLSKTYGWDDNLKIL